MSIRLGRIGALVVLATQTTGAATLYVKPTATGTADCSSWANACTLPDALAIASCGDSVWVARGIYAPFSLIDGVKIIGGFAGTETAASQSNPAANLTTVDGANNTQCVTNINDNPGGLAAYLRGFTIRNGKEADGGAGLLLQNSNAMLVQCIFQDHAANFGAAVLIRGVGSPQFVNCIFRNNGLSAASPLETYGGGALFIRDFGAPLFANCLFDNNKAEEGGAILVGEGYPTFINCTFVNNQVTTSRGGAIADFEGGVTLKNSILWNNTRDPDGAGPQPAVPDQIHNAGGTTIATYCDIQGGWPSGSGILNLDPLFQGALYQVAVNSPVKNAGNGVLPADAVDLDWDNNTNEAIFRDLGLLPRVRGGVIDLGAHEVFPTGGDALGGSVEK
jgi:predicted outer membrane repeat protein